MYIYIYIYMYIYICKYESVHIHVYTNIRYDQYSWNSHQWSWTSAKTGIRPRDMGTCRQPFGRCSSVWRCCFADSYWDNVSCNAITFRLQSLSLKLTGMKQVQPTLQKFGQIEAFKNKYFDHHGGRSAKLRLRDSPVWKKLLHTIHI